MTLIEVKKMEDRESILKRLKQIKVPRVFRQNVLLIFIFSMVISVLYYPFFLFNRSKQIGKIIKLKRKCFYLITPFIGILAMFVVSSVLIVVISRKENISLEELSTVSTLLDVTSSGKYSFYGIATQVSRIFALLCFIIPLSDLLIQLSEKMKQVRTGLPKVVANTPTIFTITGLCYTLLQVTKINAPAHLTGVYVLANAIFVTIIVLSHIYLVNVYVLFAAIKLPIQKGEN